MDSSPSIIELVKELQTLDCSAQCRHPAPCDRCYLLLRYGDAIVRAFLDLADQKVALERDLGIAVEALKNIDSPHIAEDMWAVTRIKRGIAHDALSRLSSLST